MAADLSEKLRRSGENMSIPQKSPKRYPPEQTYVLHARDKCQRTYVHKSTHDQSKLGKSSMGSKKK